MRKGPQRGSERDSLEKLLRHLSKYAMRLRVNCNCSIHVDRKFELISRIATNH